MSLLFSTEILAAVNEELSSAKNSVQIISAYCKLNAIQKLNQLINKTVLTKRIMLRFRLDDIVKGSTDFEVLDFCICNGWEVFIRFDLHAKTYIVDSKRGIVGSANTTSSGLGLGMIGNFEMASLLDIEQQDLPKIERMFRDALYVDSDLYKKLKRQVDSLDYTREGQIYKWCDEIEALFNPKISTLFSYEFPESKNLASQIGDYISFLDLSITYEREQIKEAFRWCNAYLWLLSVLSNNGGELYFGALTQILHQSLVEDPKPYRREVKEMLANLLGWIDDLKMEEIFIDRPNYSQRIRFVK